MTDYSFTKLLLEKISLCLENYPDKTVFSFMSFDMHVTRTTCLPKQVSSHLLSIRHGGHEEEDATPITFYRTVQAQLPVRILK